MGLEGGQLCWRRRAARILALGAVVLVTACGGGTKTVTVTSSSHAASASTTTSTTSTTSTASTATPPSSGTASTVLARAQSSYGVTIEVNALKRTSTNIVELDFTLVAGPNANGLGLADGGLGGRDVSDVSLVDEQGQKEYLTVQDSSGNCLCSNNLFADTPGFAANTTGHFYADITAPPATVTTVDVMVPSAPPIHNVPISP